MSHLHLSCYKFHLSHTLWCDSLNIWWRIQVTNLLFSSNCFCFLVSSFHTFKCFLQHFVVITFNLESSLMVTNRVSHPHNHCCNGNSTMCSPHTELCHCQYEKTMLSCQIYVDGNNKMYLDLHVKCPIFLPDTNQIWDFMTDYHKNPPYQLSQKYVHCSRSHNSYMQADWRDGHDMTYDITW
jgi:hypothetical protein